MKRALLGGVIAVVTSLTLNSAMAESLQFSASPSGAQEVVFDANGNFVPGGVDSTATAPVTARFDKTLTSVSVAVQIRNLVGGFAAAHFHCGLPGQNGPVAFGLVNPGPLNFDGNGIEGTLGNGDYTGADCVPIIGRPVNNIAALASAMEAGLVYLNVHSSTFPVGEIRGQMLER